jgi:hypothetical protein
VSKPAVPILLAALSVTAVGLGGLAIAQTVPALPPVYREPVSSRTPVAKATPVVFQPFKDPVHGYQMSLPSGWVLQEGSPSNGYRLAPTAGLQQQTSLHPGLDASQITVVSVGSYVAPSTDPERILRSLNSGETSQQYPLVIDGASGYYARITSGAAVTQYYVLVHNGRYILVTFRESGPGGNFADYSEDVADLVQSLKFTEQS